MENGAFDYFNKLDAMGGMVKAIDRAIRRKKSRRLPQYQRAAEAKRRSSSASMNLGASPHILYIDETVAQTENIARAPLRTRVEQCLDALKKAAAQEPKN